VVPENINEEEKRGGKKLREIILGEDELMTGDEGHINHHSMR